MLIAFPGTDQASISEVGGKGYSLIKLAAADFPVPPGIILTTAFFCAVVRTAERIFNLDRTLEFRTSRMGKDLQ